MLAVGGGRGSAAGGRPSGLRMTCSVPSPCERTCQSGIHTLHSSDALGSFIPSLVPRLTNTSSSSHAIPRRCTHLPQLSQHLCIPAHSPTEYTHDSIHCSAPVERLSDKELEVEDGRGAGEGIGRGAQREGRMRCGHIYGWRGHVERAREEEEGGGEGRGAQALSRMKWIRVESDRRLFRYILVGRKSLM